jgi:hypothetical protein
MNINLFLLGCLLFTDHWFPRDLLAQRSRTLSNVKRLIEKIISAGGKRSSDADFNNFRNERPWK